jgi:hypothetical protein
MSVHDYCIAVSALLTSQQGEAFPDPTAAVFTRSPKERYIHGDGLIRCVQLCVVAILFLPTCNPRHLGEALILKVWIILCSLLISD